MGCDIHAYREVRDRLTGQWVTLTKIPIDRCYHLFTIMAGVRAKSDEIEPIALPRGLPEDVSLIVRREFDRWGQYGHSVSWLSAKEMRQVIERAINIGISRQQLGFDLCFGWVPDPEDWYDAIRCVFFFDN